MTLDQLIALLVPAMLMAMMFVVGLQVTTAQVRAVASDRRLILKAMLANYALVPALTVGLLLYFKPVNPAVAAGFLILAVCPGAPFGPPFTRKAGGDTAVSVVLMLLLAGSSALLAPALLHVLLPLMTGGGELQVDALKIISTLLLTQLVPLALGFWLRQMRPALAERLQKPAQMLSTVLSLGVIALILASKWELVMQFRLRGYTAMLAGLGCSLLIGWLLGGPTRGSRKAMTLTTTLRNLGVALVIAMGSFAGTAAVTAVLVYGLLQIAGSALLARVWGRGQARPE